jgi:6-pyruvoyltetrahydropterin/6-carboxytetrahydropterin synthase
MAFVRITKIFNFEMAHLLQNHKGLCRNIHGHSYILHVTIGGIPKESPGSSNDGMVLDFGELKTIIQERVIEEFDHSLVINADLEKSISQKLEPLRLKIVSLSFEPTCENLISYMAAKIVNHIPAPAKLVSLKLYETTTSYAEWYADDNEMEI